MIVIGLTGGIGSGKSTVASMLAGHGAVVIEADAVVRELQRPGRPVFEAMVARFGTGIVGQDGALDRAAVARVAFAAGDAGAAARRDLEAIVHPAVADEVRRRLEEVAGTDRVVVYDVPLLVEAGRTGFAGVGVVAAHPDVAVDRLARQRGMAEADVRARIANQATRQERAAVADRVIDNSGTLDDLREQVSDLWSWLVTLGSR